MANIEFLAYKKVHIKKKNNQKAWFFFFSLLEEYKMINSQMNSTYLCPLSPPNLLEATMRY